MTMQSQVPLTRPPARQKMSYRNVGSLACETAPGLSPTSRRTLELTGPASSRTPANFTPSTSATVIAAVPFVGIRVG